MSRWLRIALAAQLTFFAAWGAYLLTSHEHARIVWLTTAPVDPRDLLSGHFVALRYVIASPATPECKALLNADEATTVYVQLAESGPRVVTPEGTAMVSQAVSCQRDPPPPESGAHWIAGRTGTERQRRGITYGIERFYIPENSGLGATPSGSVVAKVAINDDSEPRLVNLIPLRQRPE